MHLPSFRLRQPRLLAGVAIGVLVGVVGVGAVSASPAPAAAPVGPANVQAALGVAPDALLRAFRNNFRIEVSATGPKGTHDILFVRGVITLGAGQLKVTLPDNSTQVFTIDGTTIVREKGKAIAPSDLTNGERAMVFGLKNADGGYTAKLIRCVREPAAVTSTATP